MRDRITRHTPHNLAFLLAFLLLIALAWQGKRVQEALLDANRSVSRSLELITAVQALMSSLQDVETGERGFVISGQAVYLEPYWQALERLEAERRHLDALLGEPEGPRRDWLARVDASLARRLQIAAANIALRQREGLSAAAGQLVGAGGRQTTAELRVLLGELEQAERQRLADEQEALQHHLASSRGQAFAGGLLVTLLFLAALWAIRRSLHARQALASQAQAGEARLRALLQAIPDLLYEIDADGTVRPLSRPGDGDPPAALCAALRETRAATTGERVHTLQWADGAGSQYEIRRVPAGEGRHLAIARNVTAILRARRRLRDQQAFLRSVVDADENLIFVRDGAGRLQLCNRAFAALLGLRPPQVEGRLPADLPGAGWLGELFEGDAALLAGEPERRRSDLLLKNDQGQEHCLQLLKRPFRLSDGSLRILTVAVDLSARHQVEKLKGEFISTVSHELRTPLTAIRSALGMLTGHFAQQVPSDLQPLLAIAQRNSERLVRLINDILDMEKLEAGQLDFHWTLGELAPLLAQALENNEPYAREYDVRLVLEVDADAPVRLDPDRFAQVMANLLSNAVKHSPRGGLVRTRLAAHGDRLEIRVSDQGPGIPEAFRPRVFERFAQADASDARTRGGTGLGLAITRSLVQHMGGSIGFECPPGGGTCFYVWLPRAGGPPPGPQPPARPHVLVLQGDLAAANQLAALLEPHGYATLVADNAGQGRRLLEGNPVDALILGPLLADEDGAAFLTALRQQPAHAALPVLMVSLQPHDGEDAATLEGAAVGVLDWLRPPLDPARLLAAVRRGLGADGTPRVLHVEDDPDVRHLVAGLLEGHGIAAEGAANLAEARAALARHHHDIVILDLILPDGDGAELLAELGDTRPPTPVVIFSARDPGGDGPKVLRQLVKTRHDSHDLVDLIRGYFEHWPRAATDPGERPS